MDLADYFDLTDPRDIRIKGHRIGVESVLHEYLQNGLRPEEIQRRFPTLRLEQVYATILYYLRHQQDMDRYMREWLDFGRKGRAQQAADTSATLQRLRAMKLRRTAPSQA